MKMKICDFIAAAMTTAPLPPRCLRRAQATTLAAAGVIGPAGGVWARAAPHVERTLGHTRVLSHQRHPLYFISPTPFNLLGIDRWVRNFFYLTYFDSFEGTHSRVFVPRRRDRLRLRLHG